MIKPVSVIEDGIVTGSQKINRGSPVLFAVIIKFRPEKAGNGAEDKTGTMLHLVAVRCRKAKSICICEGRKSKIKLPNG